MSANRIIISIVVIALIVWGIWALQKKTPAPQKVETTTTTVQLQSGNSNSDLDRDLTTIDGQISASESSSREVDEGTNE